MVGINNCHGINHAMLGFLTHLGAIHASIAATKLGASGEASARFLICLFRTLGSKQRFRAMVRTIIITLIGNPS